LQWVREWVAWGAASETRQSFSRLSQIDRLIVRLIIFKICGFSNALFLNIGATGFHSDGWPLRLGVNLPKDASLSLAF
jgi:hypothetical protein